MARSVSVAVLPSDLLAWRYVIYAVALVVLMLVGRERLFRPRTWFKRGGP